MPIPAAFTIVPASAADVSVAVVFSPLDPLGSTSVDIEGQDTLDHARYLALIDETAARLTHYAASYRAAMHAARTAHPHA